MLPDLGTYRCTHFVVGGRIPHLPDPTAMPKVLGQQVTRNRPYHRTELYAAGGKVHRADVLVRRMSGQGYRFSLHVDSFDDPEAEPVEAPYTSQLIQLLTSWRFESQLDYDILFVLGRRATRVVFPWKFPVGGAVVDEIRGFRGVKHEANRIRYEMSIESPDLKDLYVDFEFKRTEVFDSARLQETITDMAEIVKAIIPETGWGN